MIEQKILESLNENQREAVKYTGGPLLIIAGPGTGKTTTIVNRILYLLCKDVKPHEIVALTFTNRAALEMKERIKERGDGLFIGTFHMFGLNILRMINKNFQLISRAEQLEILKSLTDGNTKKAQGILNSITMAKNLMLEKSMRDDVFLKYEEILKERNLLDIDDLIIKTVDLIKENTSLRSILARIKHVLIDEYQDINPSQYELIKCLYTFTENICAVGDADQAIYAFRGANVEHFLNFERDFKDAKTVFLKDNYRSRSIILKASQALIKHNKKRIDYPLQPSIYEPDSKIKIIQVKSEYEEARAILEEIEKRIGVLNHLRFSQYDYRGRGDGENYRFSDFAVLFRTNSQAYLIKEELSRGGIPCEVINDTVSDRIENIKDIIKANLENLDPDKTLIQILDEAFKSVDTEDLTGLKINLFMANRDYPLDVALKNIVDELYLFKASDTFSRDIDAVKLMTLHMSKGLEFKVVFITGLEEGLIPYILTKDEEDIEEERRLLYVGMTRAKDELILLHSNKRFIRGRQIECKKSRLLSEIPGDFIEEITVSSTYRPKKKPKQQGLF